MRVKGMTCLDWQLWLQQRLDGEEPPASTDLEAHLAVCSHCRALSAALGSSKWACAGSPFLLRRPI